MARDVEVKEDKEKDTNEEERREAEEQEGKHAVLFQYGVDNEVKVEQEEIEDTNLKEPSRDTHTRELKDQGRKAVVLKATNTSWSQGKTADFIESYRHNPILWDVRLKEYKNNQAKLDALRSLADQYECDVATVKSKIKNLRTAFHREHNSRNHKKSGCSPMKKNKWFGYDPLLFLVDVEIARPGYSSQVEAECIEDEPGMDDDAESSGTLPPEGPEASQDVENGVNNDDGKQTTKKKKQNNKRKTVDDDERPDEAYMVVKESVRKDDSAIYGAHVACEIQKLSPKVQVIAKHQINNILFEAAMGKYDKFVQQDNVVQPRQVGFAPPHPYHVSVFSPPPNPSVFPPQPNPWTPSGAAFNHLNPRDPPGAAFKHPHPSSGSSNPVKPRRRRRRQVYEYNGAASKSVTSTLLDPPGNKSCPPSLLTPAASQESGNDQQKPYSVHRDEPPEHNPNETDKKESGTP